jgi:hypothetical protein
VCSKWRESAYPYASKQSASTVFIRDFTDNEIKYSNKRFQSARKWAAGVKFCKRVYRDRLTVGIFHRKLIQVEGHTMALGRWVLDEPHTAAEHVSHHLWPNQVPVQNDGLQSLPRCRACVGKLEHANFPRTECEMHWFHQSDLEIRDSAVRIQAKGTVSQMNDIKALKPQSLDVGRIDPIVECGAYHLSRKDER